MKINRQWQNEGRCPCCGVDLPPTKSVFYDDIEMCPKCCHDSAPEGSPVREQMRRNYGAGND